MHVKNFLVLLAAQLCAGLGAPHQALLSPDPFKAIVTALKADGIIDEVVDDFKPKCFVAPFYGKLAIEYGTHISPSQAQHHPSLSITCPDLKQTPGMTLILTDPDAPSRKNQKWSEFCHWIAIVPTFSFPSLNADDLNEIVEYKPPGPPEKTGYHRYVFVLLEGDNMNLTKPEDRKHWGFSEKGYGVRDWAKQEGLEVVGANFFYAQNEEQ